LAFAGLVESGHECHEQPPTAEAIELSEAVSHDEAGRTKRDQVDPKVHPRGARRRERYAERRVCSTEHRYI
jgi:hypothetical protein